MVTFTLSPAFQAAAVEAGVLESVAGLGAGVEADCVAGLADGFVSLATGSQAAINTHMASIARSFVVMFVAPVSEFIQLPG
jgi:hypothetical protein